MAFQSRPGRARDIGAGGGGTQLGSHSDVWVIGNDLAPGGYAIHRWRSDHWEQVDNGQSGAVRIAVDGGGSPWVVNCDRQIFERVHDDHFERRPGSAIDIGAGGGQIWVIGTDPAPGGYGIHSWNGNDWDAVSARQTGGVRIDVDNDGTVYVIDDRHRILQGGGDGFRVLSGRARDIGAADRAWVIGTDPVRGGYAIYRRNLSSANWELVAGGATDITVDPTGRAWVVNDDYLIFEYVT